jgi:hypothetical protein
MLTFGNQFIRVISVLHLIQHALCRNLEIYFNSAVSASEAANKLRKLHDGVSVSYGNVSAATDLSVNG